jgi:hypothetical protein
MTESLEQIPMVSFKVSVVLTAVIAAAALAGCRKEVAHKPMKLGGDLPAVEQVKR